jgi:hypothetical protein
MVDWQASTGDDGSDARLWLQKNGSKVTHKPNVYVLRLPINARHETMF